MSDETEITVRKLRWPVPIDLLGLDEQGRQTYRCPSRGCGETAYFDEDGRGHCPVGDAEDAFWASALETLMVALEPSGTVPDWARGKP